MQKYNNDFVVPSSWTSLSAVSLPFIGTLTPKVTNTDVIQIRGASQISTSGTLDASKGEYEPCYAITDLADIQVQCPGTINQVLKIYGEVNPAAATLTNLK